MSEKTLIIDAHVHIYPNYDLAMAISNSLVNMDEAKPEKETAKIWLLSERADCSAFEQLLRTAQIGMYHVVPTGEPGTLRVQLGERIVLYILAGRQVITADGLEVCALASGINIPDRELDAASCIQTALDAGALVSLNWAPGKWFGKRGKIVSDLFARDVQPGLFIGDSAMRPTFWSEPKLMRSARAKGWRILAGSDPLPFSGEERTFGRYGCMITGEWDVERPAASLVALLTQQDVTINLWGMRRGPFEFFRRQIAIMREKKKREGADRS
jgi:hypothetical protein